jgi:hypothetical protein
MSYVIHMSLLLCMCSLRWCIPVVGNCLEAGMDAECMFPAKGTSILVALYNTMPTAQFPSILGTSYIDRTVRHHLMIPSIHSSLHPSGLILIPCDSPRDVRKGTKTYLRTRQLGRRANALVVHREMVLGQASLTTLGRTTHLQLPLDIGQMVTTGAVVNYCKIMFVLFVEVIPA